MGTFIRQRAGSIVVGVVAALALVLTGIAIAGSVPDKQFTGGALVQTKIAAETTRFDVSDAAKGWVDVLDAEVSLSVPSGQNRLIVATFNAETSCGAVGKAWCAMRIVAQRAGGGVQELFPRTGTDFAIDSGNGEQWEGNTAIRSMKIGSGSWQVRVQARVVGTGNYDIDDWHFQVDVHK